MGKPRKKKQEKQARPANLLDTVKSWFTPDLVHRASSMVGEPEAATRRTLDESAACVLRGLSRVASSQDRAAVLDELLSDSRYSAFADNVAGLFSGGNATANAVISGHELLQTIFGSNVSWIEDQVASSGGVAASSADKLMALVAPLTLGVLSKRAAAQELDSSEIANLLRDAGSGTAATFPSDSPPARAAGPVLVPKRSAIAPEQETSDQISFTSSGTEPGPAELAAPSHKLRSILFLLAGLILLALLILLLIRGPVHRDSLPRGAGPIEALITQSDAAATRVQK